MRGAGRVATPALARRHESIAASDATPTIPGLPPPRNLSSSPLPGGRPGGGPHERTGYDGYPVTAIPGDETTPALPNALLIFRIIHGKHGKNVAEYSRIPKEDERLFTADTRFKVLAREEREGKVWIELEEVE